MLGTSSSLARVAEWALATILLVGLVGKLQSPAGLVRAVRMYRAVPSSLAHGVAILAIAVEAAILIGLFLGASPVWTIVGGLWLLAMAALLAHEAAAGAHHDCGCLGGKVSIQIGWHSAVIAIVFAMGALASGLIGGESNEGSIGMERTLIPFLVGSLLGGMYWTTQYSLSVVASLKLGEATQQERGE